MLLPTTAYQQIASLQFFCCVWTKEKLMRMGREVLFFRFCFNGGFLSLAWVILLQTSTRNWNKYLVFPAVQPLVHNSCSLARAHLHDDRQTLQCHQWKKVDGSTFIVDFMTSWLGVGAVHCLESQSVARGAPPSTAQRTSPGDVAFCVSPRAAGLTHGSMTAEEQRREWRSTDDHYRFETLLSAWIAAVVVQEHPAVDDCRGHQERQVLHNWTFPWSLGLCCSVPLVS